MGAKPLADAYEKLKELRREAPVGQSSERLLAELRKKLDAVPEVADKAVPLVRAVEIKTLADRVFGDEDKAEAWLQRPNRALSGQTPAELLQDELGTAVVRELLERIDHGIFA
jgi:putative toxin-antitoxin system antitoxin component (TIGR02293 family)